LSDNDGWPEEEEKGPLDGEEWLGEIVYAVNYIQQLCCQRRTAPWGDD
jgi:hypothetical protein